MGFFSGIIIGFAIGITLIIAFAKQESTRSKRRIDLAKMIAKFARLTVEDSRKLLPPNFYPSWVLNWLNRIEIVEEGSGPSGVTMEFDMQWDGNPDIVLDIKTKVGLVLPVQVKNIGFTGVFRLIFKPLVNDFPAFGAVLFSLREKKSLDFTLKVIGGDISALPGVSEAIEETIRDAIEDSITWPVRQIIPIIPGDYSNLELKPVGTLDVKLVQAKNLTNKDLIGKSDPFAVAAELIGCAQVSLKELEPGKVKVVWLKLVKDLQVHRDNKYRGEVHLELLYCPFGVEHTFKSPFNADYSLTTFEKTLKSDAKDDDTSTSSRKKSNVIVRGVLSVTVISAEDLPVVDLMGKADPFVVLSLKKSEKKQKTRVVNESLNPVWNQTFDFVVEDGLHDMLIVELWDHDTFGKEKMGKVIMTLTKVILEGEYEETFVLDDAKSGKINLHLKWAAQHKYREP
ncbi:hypothetical protein TSUD_305790 [Trifolium subterraneum]|uniref:C2 domain-containing protein n=1 Tax=Trifolium subterraneum TaxID=3900 RepID=A0A2Z6LUM1_TRISU|nr:hypothetical protein TSUD_305790 [Trifolium subterraneum]